MTGAHPPWAHAMWPAAGDVLCPPCCTRVLSGCPMTRSLPELLPLSHLSAHLSHLITLRLCLCALVSLATCLQQWRELWPRNGRRTVPWRDKARLRGNRGKWKPGIKAEESEGMSHDICRAQTRLSELGDGGKRGGSEADETRKTKPNLCKLRA